MVKQDSRLHAFISGRVQGVGFRHFVLQNAQNLELTGWVRNLYDGRVEVTAEGVKDDLENLLKMLKSGPPSARVENLDEEWTSPSGQFSGFHVRYTG